MRLPVDHRELLVTPEVIDWEPSTFDPEDIVAMAALTERALTDGAYRRTHRGVRCRCRHSWDAGGALHRRGGAHPGATDAPPAPSARRGDRRPACHHR